MPPALPERELSTIYGSSFPDYGVATASVACTIRSMSNLTGRSYQAFLFDMDGTILSSIAAAERVWAIWAKGHGLDVKSFLPTIHGVQSVETIRRLNLAGIDPAFEAAEITRREIEDVNGIDPIPGARAFLSALPAGRWAVVTSAPLALATARLKAAKLPAPPVIVTADDVPNGKPAPDCFLLAAKKLGTSASQCLVFEDSAAGISAAEAAGADVVVVTSTHRKPMATRHVAILDFRAVRSHVDEGGKMVLSVSGV
jgi:sugar-phosphatase